MNRITPKKDGKKGLSYKKNADLLWDFANDIHHVFSRAEERAVFLDRLAMKRLYKNALKCITQAENYFFGMHTKEGTDTARTLALLRRRLAPHIEEYISNLLSMDSIGNYWACREIERAEADFNDDIERLAVAFEYPLPPQTPDSCPTAILPDFRIKFPSRNAMEGKQKPEVRNADIEKIVDEMALEGEMYIADFCAKYSIPRTTAQYWIESPSTINRKCPDTGAVIVSIPSLIELFIRWKNKTSKTNKKSKNKPG